MPVCETFTNFKTMKVLEKCFLLTNVIISFSKLFKLTLYWQPLTMNSILILIDIIIYKYQMLRRKETIGISHKMYAIYKSMTFIIYTIF
jgi:hypothetical protein